MDCFGFMDVHFVLFTGTSPAVPLLPGSDWNCHVSPEQQLSLPQLSEESPSRFPGSRPDGIIVNR